MALFLLHRPNGAEHLRNHAAIHGALISAADGAAAIVAANAMVPDIATPFDGFTAVLVANEALPGFANALVQGDFVGNGTNYSGPRRGH